MHMTIDTAQTLTALEKAPRMDLTDAEWREVVGILDRAAAYYQGEHPVREGSFGPVDGPNEVLVRRFHEKKMALFSAGGRDRARSPVMPPTALRRT